MCADGHSLATRFRWRHTACAAASLGVDSVYRELSGGREQAWVYPGEAGRREPRLCGLCFRVRQCLPDRAKGLFFDEGRV